MDIDILVITHQRAGYARKSISRLLETMDSSMRLWLWHNGTDEETLAVAESFRQDAHAFHHSPVNEKLVAPTNWLWSNAKGSFLSKVDDDCLMPDGWADELRATHAVEPRLGAIACWLFHPDDFLPGPAKRKILALGTSGRHLYRNCWVPGSGYLMKRACVEQLGLLGERGNPTTFTQYCIRLAASGWMNGFAYPFVQQDHMDDPRSPNTALRSEADFDRWLPLSARSRGITTLEEWRRSLSRNAREVQRSPLDPRWQSGWRRRLRGVSGRLMRAIRS